MRGVTVTIALCTYNRSRLLSRAIEALLREPGIGHGSEVLVVDNRSTDDTAAIASSYAERYPFVRVVREEQQGLSHARNRAFRSSEAEYVAYLDDDAVVQAGWLGAFFDAVECSGHAGAIGGPIYPDFEEEPPWWFDAEYVTRRFGRAEGPLGPLYVRQGFSGGNMAIRRDLLEGIGGFDPALGMAGERVHFGEESDLFQRLYERHGNVTYYAPAMAIRHLEPVHKQRPGYLARRMFASGQLFTEVTARASGRGAALLLGSVKAAKQLAQGGLRVPLTFVQPRQLFRAFRNVVTASGVLWGVLRLLAGRVR